MADMMVAATKNSASVHFGFGSMCRAHNTLFTMEHVEQCSEILGCKNIRTYAHKLKEVHILRVGTLRRGTPQNWSSLSSPCR